MLISRCSINGLRRFNYQTMQKLKKVNKDKYLHWLVVVIIIVGIALRLVYYFQNRCLFIDEANIARNIYERSFIGLTKPLNYEQYAPPLFLWIIKISTLLFGYSEFAFRLFPLLCGIVSLFLFNNVLKRFTAIDALWYPLIIVATGFIYINYSTELKQYIVDVVVIQLLILLALKTDIINGKNAAFFWKWAIAGSVAVWLSMPSVFMLAGVGAYYCYGALNSKRYAKFFLLISVCLIWLLQFALYYYLILKPQISSSYLQNWHKEFFLNFLPVNKATWNDNVNALDKLIEATGGKWALSVVFHLLTLAIGAVYLLLKQRGKFLLISIPVFALLLAAALHQYALTPRLVLFIMPVILLFVGVGLHQLFRINDVLSAVLVVIAAICIFNFGAFSLFYKRVGNEEISQNLDFLLSKNINSGHLAVNNLAVPAFIYYTAIHPAKDKWKNLKEAAFLNWNSNYDSLSTAHKQRWALLYSWMPDDELNAQQNIIRKDWKVVDTNTVTGGKVFIYDK